MKIRSLVVAALATFTVLASGCGAKKFDIKPVSVTPSEDAEVIARGEYLFHGPSHCSACHTKKEVGIMMGKGDKPVPSGGGEWIMGPLGTLRSANLTSDKETGIGARSDEDIARIIKYGQRADGSVSPFMALALGDIADDDIAAIVSYMRSLAPVKNEVKLAELSFLGNMILGGLTPRNNVRATAPPMGATVERGEYIARSAAFCVGCHSNQKDFRVVEGTEFGGSNQPMESEFADDKFKYIAPNLTPDPETGIAGKWTEEQFLARFEAGRAYRGSPMPWGNYQNMSQDDLKAVWMYLQTVKPIKNEIPLTAVPTE
jgi:mono/diheme cytochrome c family protein